MTCVLDTDTARNARYTHRAAGHPDRRLCHRLKRRARPFSMAYHGHLTPYSCSGYTKSMATLSMFFGIIITMFREKGTRHHIPHFHAEYQGEEVVVSLDGEVLDGSIPRKKFNLVIAWAEIHNEELKANWKLLSEGREFFKIDPLR
jgi:hypothetical protein